MEELYREIQLRRGYPNLPVYNWKRQPPEQWAKTRKRIFKRDGGLCQSPENAPPKRAGVCQRETALDVGHIDHIRPISSGGSNHHTNLRVLCPVCHALREDIKHKALRDRMVKKGLLPINYSNLIWK
jgi:5-methylcytosine-specific restriction endonuclease McrA